LVSLDLQQQKGIIKFAFWLGAKGRGKGEGK
jgi:hypothetical protein